MDIVHKSGISSRGPAKVMRPIGRADLTIGDPSLTISRHCKRPVEVRLNVLQKTSASQYSSDVKRNQTLGIRLTSDERRLIDAAARQCGKTPSAWLRSTGLAAARVAAVQEFGGGRVVSTIRSPGGLLSVDIVADDNGAR